MSAAAVEPVKAGDVAELAFAAKRAGRKLASLSASDKDQILSRIAASLERHVAEVLRANEEDAAEARVAVDRGEMSKALYQRLLLSPEKLQGMIDGVRAVAKLDDPAGKMLQRTLLDDGLILEKVSVPLGLLAIIFEARPDAITQISALAIKSGNAVILKGGREVERTMAAVLVAIHEALRGSGLVDEAAVSGVYGRAPVEALLKLSGTIDLVIPRGSNALVQHIQNNTDIPVLGHADGVCHVYIDAAADLDMAIAIAVDSKVQYPAVCNAAETILVHRAIAEAALPALADALEAKQVKIRGDGRTRGFLSGHAVDLVGDDEWHTEYSDLVVAVRVVDDLDEALDHIERYGSHHTDSIVTEDADAARRFLDEVDSANVLHNCSTRFSDGFRYGFGSEVGISTSKLHARGPVGLEGLVTYKYRLLGHGQVVKDYAGKPARPFKHLKL
ncbi:Gamma-glutamyl phosphate reductase [Acidisarcina polymorpha]|uniref:Gamma-glutamyl phosphate reductase n=1 Tax=Acidisarcina polymorpha TaxID=2211140 RepID=A0A2Z5G6S1_9BACT|nr:glutamate-5-semialdehyde dehydrogenase [Acidisarcina polymorpha]AXC14374.1 Gamma-glutamyl phosphate reductase [Acidisarcina polymorpha]